MVNTIPAMLIMRETTNVKAGPERAKSNICVRVDGNDRSGVIDPKVPISKDGRGTGSPIVMLDCLAVI